MLIRSPGPAANVLPIRIVRCLFRERDLDKRRCGGGRAVG